MAEKVAEESAPAKPHKSRFGWKAIVVGAAALLFIAGGGTFAALKYIRAAGAAAAEAKAKKESVQSVLNLDPFLVNLADKEAVRFVKVTFRLGVNEKDIEAELGKDNVFLAAARDSVISLLSSKTSDEILSPEGKVKLRQEVQSRINAVLPRGKVLEVYIIDFVVQL